MGFLLAPLGVAMLYASVVGFRIVYKKDWTGLYEAITGFGLGGSAIALFGRVGGGIYTKVRSATCFATMCIPCCLADLRCCQHADQVCERCQSSHADTITDGCNAGQSMW